MRPVADRILAFEIQFGNHHIEQQKNIWQEYTGTNHESVVAHEGHEKVTSAQCCNVDIDMCIGILVDELSVFYHCHRTNDEK